MGISKEELDDSIKLPFLVFLAMFTVIILAIAHSIEQLIKINEQAVWVLLILFIVLVIIISVMIIFILKKDLIKEENVHIILLRNKGTCKNGSRPNHS